MQQDNANNKTSGSCPRFLFTIPLLTSPRLFFIFSSSAPSSSPDHPIDLQGWNAISKLAGIFRAATVSLYDRICTACSTELAVKKIPFNGSPAFGPPFDKVLEFHCVSSAMMYSGLFRQIKA
jgi:hypothetical protein